MRTAPTRDVSRKRAAPEGRSSGLAKRRRTIAPPIQMAMARTSDPSQHAHGNLQDKGLLKALHPLKQQDRQEIVGNPVADVSIRVGDEFGVGLAADLAIGERAHLAPRLQIAGVVFERIDLDRAVRLGGHFGLPERGKQAQRAIDLAAAGIPAGNPRGIRFGIGNGLLFRRRIREVTVEEGAEQDRPEFIRLTLFPQAVERHEDADIFVEQEMQIAVERLRVAGMADDAQSVAVLLVEAEVEAVDAGRHLRLRRMHQSHGRGAEDRCAVIAALLEMGDHEMRHVRAGGRQRAGRRRFDVLEIARLLVGGLKIALGHAGIERRGQRLHEGRMQHAQRRQNVVGDVVGVGFARQALHDVARQRAAIVRIGDDLAWRIDAGRHVLHQIVAQGKEVARLFHERLGNAFLKPRRMGHEVAHRDGLPELLGNLEIEIVVHVAIEIDLSRLDELHDGSPGEELRNRTGAKQRLVRNDRLAARHVGIAIALREQDFAVLDDDENAAGDVSARQRIGHQAVEEHVSVFGRQIVRCCSLCRFIHTHRRRCARH